MGTNFCEKWKRNSKGKHGNKLREGTTGGKKPGNVKGKERASGLE